jgi:Flp pilus assembly protein TadD
MNRAATRKRRVAILLGLFVLAAALVASLYAFRQWQKQSRAQQHRLAGIAAVEAGHYPQAVDHLERYLRVEPQDIEARYHFAQARLHVPEPHNQHLGAAADALRQVLAAQPNHPDARRDLMELYTLTGSSAESLKLADALLAQDADDFAALRCRAISLSRLSRFDEALAAAQRGIAANPLDVQLQLLAIQVRHEMGEDDQQLLDLTEQLRLEHPDDPRFELLQAYVYSLAEDQSNSVRWLQTAASRTPPDEQFTQTLLQLLDQADLFEQSLTLLNRLAHTDPDSTLYIETVRRLFEAGEFQDVVQKLDSLTADPAQFQSELLGLKAVALRQLDQPEAASAIIATLADRKGDVIASAWAAWLGASALPMDPAQRLRAIRSAAETVSTEAYFAAELGDAWAAMDETELALAAWRNAAQWRPVWALPFIQIAAALLEQGSVTDALQFAEAGLLRQPTSIAAAATYVQARSARITDPHSPELRAVVRLLDQIESQVPGEPAILLLRVSLLIQTGQWQQAADLISSALDAQTPLSEPALLQLIHISETYALGLEDDCYQRLQQSHGLTPNAALAQALDLAADGRETDGAALLQSALTDAPVTEQPSWRLALAQYLDSIGDPQAANLWATLAHDAPNDLQVQRLLIQSPAVQSDRPLIDAALQRLQKAAGEKSFTWRLARARWLLRPDASTREVEEATSLLRQMVTDAPTRLEARLLLAQGYQTLGRIPLAIRELQAAARQRPELTSIALDLAQLYQTLRSFQVADEQLNLAVANPAATPADLRRAAAMLAQQGEDLRAIQVLEHLQQRSVTTGLPDQLLLASLYRRTNQLEKTQEICQSLLANPTPAGIMFVAAFYAASDRQPLADQALALLDNLNLAPALREQLLAAHDARLGRSDQALLHYRAAVDAAPNDAALWRGLIAYQLQLGSTDAALDAVSDALNRHQLTDPSLQVLHDHADLIKSAAAADILLPLVLSILTDPANHPLALDALLQTRDPSLLAADRAAKLGSLALANRNFLDLQNVATRAYLLVGRPDDAAEIAVQAMNAFPTHIEPAWLAAEALAAADRWQEALLAATEWRRRSTGQSLDADMIIAEAKLRLGEVGSALREITPYLQQALADPQTYPQVITRYVRGLIANGEVPAAAHILSPLLPQSAEWRSLWIRLAALAIADVQLSSDWLNQVTELIPAEALNEQLTLAQSWWTLADRAADPAAYRLTAREIADRVIAQPDAPASAFFLHGLMAEAAGDLTTAEADYRAVLGLNPQHLLAKNNLVMLLVDTQSDMTEAITLAQQIVQAAPHNANYRDTLAFAQAKAQQYDDAIATMRAAIQLDPGNPKWLRRLADVLQSAGQNDEAAKVLDDLQIRFLGSVVD